MKPKVKVENISKSYQLYTRQADKLLDIISVKSNRKSKNFNALHDVSFEVFEGETIGVVGINGSGKSTLSNILAEVIPPTSGMLEINGETSLIAISVGLNGQLSGLENIKLKCTMLGMYLEEITTIIPDIVEFADIGQFIDQPVKNYSSGMKSRLGFAISVFTNPDILVVDEALSVGDNTFYERCINKINQFKEEGKTIFFISHSINQMRSISDRVLWLHYGEVKEFGEVNEVLNSYETFISWYNYLSKEEQNQYKGKMQQQQSIEVQWPKSRYESKKKKMNYHTLLPITFLLISTFLSALLMFLE